MEVFSSTTGGKIHLGVFDSPDGFAAEDFLVNATAELDKESDRTQLTIELPAAGDYVFAAFQDLNGNGELDRNMLGVPTEPYGFSKAAPSKWRMPSFSEVATAAGGAQDKVVIEVRHWKEY